MTQTQLFHNNFRQIIYLPNHKTLKSFWFGTVPDLEIDHNIQCVGEILKLYQVEHFIINLKKAKSISMCFSRKFIEGNLKNMYSRGGKSLTLIQKKTNESSMTGPAYRNAISSYGIKMEFIIKYE